MSALLEVYSNAGFEYNINYRVDSDKRGAYSYSSFPGR